LLFISKQSISINSDFLKKSRGILGGREWVEGIPIFLRTRNIMILSNTERKKLVDILISMCILYFIVISDFGT